MGAEIDDQAGHVAWKAGTTQPLPGLISGIVGAQPDMVSRSFAGEVMRSIVPAG
jgi:hypothetical protein